MTERHVQVDPSTIDTSVSSVTIIIEVPLNSFKGLDVLELMKTNNVNLDINADR